MKKTIFYALSFLIVVSLISSGCVIRAFAEEIIEFAKDVSILISEDAEFSDNKIIVVLTGQGSLDYDNINEDYFSFIDCKNIRELTSLSTHKVRAVIDNIRDSIANGQKTLMRDGTNFSSYRRILCLELNNAGRKNVIDAINKINKLDGVLCAIPNYKLSIDSIDETEAITQTRSVNDQTPNEIYSLIDLDDAWTVVSELNTSTVRVAVIDSGIDTEHHALIGTIDTTTSAIFRNYSGDGTNYEEDGVLGEHIDERGHGTHVAGIITASYNSATETRGVCSSVELVSIKILDDNGEGELADLISAMKYIESLDETADAIQIVNISAGVSDWYYQEENQEELENAIFDYDGLVVCSAGNSNQNLDNVNVFPASIEGNNIITVGASDADDTRWVSSNLSGSNYNGSVDIFAPGVDIVSCVPIGTGAYLCSGDNCTKSEHIAAGYHTLTGTSMATPFVTGVAALMLSVNSSLDAERIKDIIVDTENTDYSASSSELINDLFMICESGGRLNAYKAVSAVLPTSCSHSSIYYTSTGLTHTIHCNNCDYTASEPHDNRYLTVSPERHVYVCRDCGYGIYEPHTPQYTIYSDEEHKVRCSGCGYTIFADHNLYLYERNDDDPSTIMCSDCGYIVDCAETVDYVNGGASGHYVTCDSDCFELFEDHTLMPTGSYSSSGHMLECLYCNYTANAEHELYTYEIYEGDNGCTVKCNLCDYSIDCGGNPEFDSFGYDGHYVDCVCGSDCFSFTEEHHNEYLTQGVGSHLAICELCDYYAELSHNWSDTGEELVCVDCEETISYSQLNALSDLTDEEIAVLISVLPIEKIETILASLPEEDLSRITALLPPENEDELLTE